MLTVSFSPGTVPGNLGQMQNSKHLEALANEQQKTTH